MKIKIKCIICEKEFETQECWIKKHHKDHNFCSKKCFGIWKQLNFKGENNPNFGCNTLSHKVIGKNNPFYGKHHTEVTKDKISNKISVLEKHDLKNMEVLK